MGRTSSMTTMSTKAAAARHCAPTLAAASASATPTIRPPSSAPGTLPMPPRIAAANSGSSMSKPMKGRICTVRPSMTPEAQASAPPIAQVMRTMRSTSTPATRASVGFSLTARMARPVCVRVSSRCRPATSTTVMIKSAI